MYQLVFKTRFCRGYTALSMRSVSWYQFYRGVRAADGTTDN